MTQKALLQSAGDGTAVPVGYSGQFVSSISSSNVTLASNSWNQITSITLSSGVWLVSFSNKWWRNSSTPTTEINIASTFGSSTSEIQSNFSTKYSYRCAAQILFNPVVSVQEHILCNSGVYVRSDGTNLYFGDGTVIVSGSQTLVLATYSNAYTGSIPTILGYSLFAVRIA